MISMGKHSRWFAETTDGASGRAAAMAAQVPVATLNRQLAKGELTSDMVMALARGYGRSPVTALVETGYLTPAEARELDVIESARLLSDQELVRELARRVDDNEAAWRGTFDVVVEEGQTPADQPQEERSADQAKQWPPVLGRKVTGPSTREESDGRGNLG